MGGGHEHWRLGEWCQRRSEQPESGAVPGRGRVSKSGVGGWEKEVGSWSVCRREASAKPSAQRETAELRAVAAMRTPLLVSHSN